MLITQSACVHSSSSRSVRTCGSIVSELCTLTLQCVCSNGIITLQCESSTARAWRLLQRHSPNIFVKVDMPFRLCLAAGLCTKVVLNNIEKAHHHHHPQAQPQSLSKDMVMRFALMDIVVRMGGAGCVSQYVAAMSFDEKVLSQCFLLSYVHPILIRIRLVGPLPSLSTSVVSSVTYMLR